MKKGLVIGLLGIAVLAGVVLTYEANQEPPQQAAQTKVQVALATAQNSVLPHYYSSVGTLEASQQVIVTAELGGRIAQLHFDSGQAVKKGQLLVTLNTETELAQQARLTAVLRNAEQRLKRIRQLLPSGAATREQGDQAVADRDAAAAELKQVNAVIAQKTIRAPFAGQAGIRQVNLGQYLYPGDPITSLSDNQHLRVNFSLDESTSAELSKAQQVELQVRALPGLQFKARIISIDPILDENRQTRLQAILEDQHPTLRSGMFAEVRVRRPQQQPSLNVPRTAVTATAYGKVVFVARDAGEGLHVQRVLVTTGNSYADSIEITQGLNPGDQVVVSGQIKLSDGTPIEAVSSNALEPTQAAIEPRP